MREWKVAQMYEIMDYTFAVGVAWDDPHVLGTFAGRRGSKLSLIDETVYKEDSEIDYFASITFPSLAAAYISGARALSRAENSIISHPSTFCQ